MTPTQEFIFSTALKYGKTFIDEGMGDLFPKSTDHCLRLRPYIYFSRCKIDGFYIAKKSPIELVVAREFSNGERRLEVRSNCWYYDLDGLPEAVINKIAQQLGWQPNKAAKQAELFD